MKKLFAVMILKFLGWKIDIQIPKEKIKRAVIVCAPHTSNWDFLYAILVFWILEIPMKIFIKSSHIKAWYGFFIKQLGGIGVEHKKKVL